MGPGVYFIYSAAIPSVYLSPGVYMNLDKYVSLLTIVSVNYRILPEHIPFNLDSQSSISTSNVNNYVTITQE